MRIITFISIILLSITACNRNKNEKTLHPLAQVGNKTLYLEDLQKVISPGLASADSSLHAQNYINSWIKKQLLLNKASLNLTAEQKDLSLQLEEYKSALLIYKYESQFVAEKMDTVVVDSVINNYYAKFKDNFKLNKIAVKGLYIRIPNDIPKLKNINYWIRSKRTEDSTKLADYCLKFADKYDDFLEDWIYFPTLQNLWPKKMEKPENLVRFNNLIIEKDSLFSYFFRIDDYRLKGDLSPLQFEYNKIKNIVLNKRRINIISTLEQDIFNEGLKTNSFKLYQKEKK